MDSVNLSLILVILAVAVFDFSNGFHDAADMVATAIASRAMTPAVAIGIVSGFTFIAPFTVGLAVTDTVGTFVNKYKEELTPYFPYSTKKRKILTTPTSSGASEI